MNKFFPFKEDPFSDGCKIILTEFQPLEVNTDQKLHFIYAAKTYEPMHNKTYNKTCVPQQRLRSAIAYWVDVQADLSLCWLHVLL